VPYHDGKRNTNKNPQPKLVEKLSQADAKPASASEETALDIHGFAGCNDEKRSLNFHFLFQASISL
jgi:hypothetical protein